MRPFPVNMTTVYAMRSSALLQTAIAHFGQFGFDGASTRSIASAAGTTMSSITYHFGSKEGLYLAAARHIAREIAALEEPAIAAVAARPASSREEAIESAVDLLVDFAQILMRPEASAWARFIAREQHDPTPAFELLYSGVMKPLADIFISLLSQIDPALSELDQRARTILLFGQALVLQTSRASVLRILGIQQTEEAAADILLFHLRRNTREILTGH